MWFYDRLVLNEQRQFYSRNKAVKMLQIILRGLSKKFVDNGVFEILNEFLNTYCIFKSLS